MSKTRLWIYLHQKFSNINILKLGLLPANVYDQKGEFDRGHWNISFLNKSYISTGKFEIFILDYINTDVLTTELMIKYAKKKKIFSNDFKSEFFFF